MIQIFVTGGTFDKEYDMINGTLFFKDTHLEQLLEMGRCMLDTDINTLMLKDSLDLTSEDRKLILDSCIDAPTDKIVITHGTDTIVETATLLAENIKNKTIILTGAIIPIKFGSSDGFFNLGSSLAFAQSLPHGIYISMHGRYFDWNNVKKNKEKGIFEEIR
jgi:L-asparaginase